MQSIMSYKIHGEEKLSYSIKYHEWGFFKNVSLEDSSKPWFIGIMPLSRTT